MFPQWPVSFASGSEFECTHLSAHLCARERKSCFQVLASPGQRLTLGCALAPPPNSCLQPVRTLSWAGRKFTAMAWGGVEAIPLRLGESVSDAVDRVYAGGKLLSITGDGLLVGAIPGPERDVEMVSSAQWAWMRAALATMQDLRPGWVVVEELRGDGRRWPWSMQLEHPVGCMWVQLGSDSITFRLVKGSAVDDDEWSFWWRTIRRFASWPAAIFHPDTAELVAPSLSARAARARYNWM